MSSLGCEQYAIFLFYKLIKEIKFKSHTLLLSLASPFRTHSSNFGSHCWSDKNIWGLSVESWYIYIYACICETILDFSCLCCVQWKAVYCQHHTNDNPLSIVLILKHSYKINTKVHKNVDIPNIETLSTVITPCVGNPPVADYFPHEGPVTQIFYILCCYSVQVVKQALTFPVIWDNTTCEIINKLFCFEKRFESAGNNFSKENSPAAYWTPALFHPPLVSNYQGMTFVPTFCRLIRETTADTAFITFGLVNAETLKL